MDPAARICARLLYSGTAPRAELADLDFAEPRAEVERRLASVGLALASSVYSDHVGIRLSEEVVADPAFDAASNLGLGADGCALLVVLWARLVLQKRAAAETHELPGQVALLPGEQARAAREHEPSVRLATLLREFGPVLGSATHVKALVSQLRRLGFVLSRGEEIRAGPLLELGLDGERMLAFIRRSGVLEQVRREGEESHGEAPESAEAQLLRVLAELGGPASIAEIAARTSERRERLRGLLRELIEAGRVVKIGDRGQTRYRLEGK